MSCYTAASMTDCDGPLHPRARQGLSLFNQGRYFEAHEELEAAVREHGVESIKEVDLAVLEVDGNISVLSQNFLKKSMKRRRAHKIISKDS